MRGVLRHIKTIPAAERARQRLRSAQQWLPGDPTIANLGFQSLDEETPRHKGRRDGRPDTYFAELARRYVAALAEPGVAQRASQHLAKEDHVEVSTMYQRLHEARRRGLLTKPTTPGKAGGRLTKYALELLDEDKEET